MANENDTIEIKDEDIEHKDFTPEELSDESIDWKAKATELAGIAKRRGTQLAKVKEKLKNANAHAPTKKEEPSQNSNELNYAVKAFLKSSGISNAKEIELVKTEQKNSGLEFDELLENPYFKTKLEQFRTAEAVAQATPASNRGGTGADNAKNTKEFWLAKGELTLTEKMQLKSDNPALFLEVVNARIAQDKSGYQSPKK